MNSIAGLTEELCPWGVIHQEVGSLLEKVKIPKKVPRGKILPEGPIPVIDQSQSFISGYTFDETSKIDVDEVIVFGDHTRALKYVNFPFAAGADGTVPLRAKSGFDTKFLFHCLRRLEIPNRGYNRHWTVLRNMTIPSPPLEIQKEIVNILDKFTQLEAELEAELEAREKQYEEVRRRLLDFESDTSNHPLGEMISEMCPEGVTLDEVESTIDKVRIPKKVPKGMLVAEGAIPVIDQSQSFIAGYTFDEATKIDLEEVLVFGDHTRAIKYVNFSFAAGADGTVPLRAKSGFSTKFLYHCLKRIEIPNRGYNRHWTVLRSMLIPTPPLEIQKEIVRILDNMDSLVNSVNEGIPAEIAARRKQYEYYRDKLLTFKELDAA